MYKRLKIAALGAFSCLLLFLLWIGICWKRPWCSFAPESFPAWVPEDWGPNASPKPKELLINGEKRLVYSVEDEKRTTLHAEQSVPGGKFVLEEAQIDSQSGLLNLYGHAVGVADFFDQGIRPQLHEEKEGGVNGISWPIYATRKPGQPEDEVPFTVQFSCPPRFARKLYVRIFLNKARLLGKTGEALPPFVDIAFDNPLRQIPRSRNAETLPASRNLDSIKLELLKVETEIPPDAHNGGMQPRSAHDGALPCATRIRFRLVDTRDNQPANAWRLTDGVFLSSPEFIKDFNSPEIGDVKSSKEDPSTFVANRS